jgi:TRAP-type uncharacterized transport system fused permease subunit
MELRPEKKMVLSGAFAMLVANVCFIGWVITRSADWAAWAMLAMLVSLFIPLLHTWFPRAIKAALKKLREPEPPKPSPPEST